MSKIVDEAFEELIEKNLSESQLLEIAQKIIGSVVNVKSKKEVEAKAAKEERYQFVKERILKSNAKKVKTLKNTIVSYFRSREGGISNNEVDSIVKRLVAEKLIFINAKDEVEFL